MLDGVSVLASVQRRTSWQILLVCEHKQETVLHLSVAQNPVQLLFGLVYPLPVLAVHDEHEALCASVVMSPEWPDLVLPSDIPDVEPHVLVCYSLDIEPNYGVSEVASQWDVKDGQTRTCGDGRDGLVQLELVENG